MRAEDYESEPYGLWPCNVEAFTLWRLVGDQWRVGPGGCVSLDLMPVFHELDRMKLKPARYDELLMQIKAMSHEALRQMPG